MQAVQRRQMLCELQPPLVLRHNALPIPLVAGRGRWGGIGIGTCASFDDLGGRVAAVTVHGSPAAGPLRQHAGRSEEDFRVDCEAAQLNNVLGDGAREDVLLVDVLLLRGGLTVTLDIVRLGAEPAAVGEDVGARAHGALLHEMGDDVQPLAVPAQHARPHLEGLVDANLALEAALHAAEHDAPAAEDGIALGVEDELLLGVVVEARDARLQEAAHEVRPRHVQVREVRRVGLVEVVVAFGERRARAGDDGEEERRGRELRRDDAFAEDAVPEDGIEDSVLFDFTLSIDVCVWLWRRGIGAGGATTHMPCKRHILEIRDHDQERRDARVTPRASEGAGKKSTEVDP